MGEFLLSNNQTMLPLSQCRDSLNSRVNLSSRANLKVSNSSRDNPKVNLSSKASHKLSLSSRDNLKDTLNSRASHKDSLSSKANLKDSPSSRVNLKDSLKVNLRDRQQDSNSKRHNLENSTHEFNIVTKPTCDDRIFEI